jgi:hypothetical protein
LISNRVLSDGDAIADVDAALLLVAFEVAGLNVVGCDVVDDDVDPPPQPIADDPTSTIAAAAAAALAGAFIA